MEQSPMELIGTVPSEEIGVIKLSSLEEAERDTKNICVKEMDMTRLNIDPAQNGSNTNNGSETFEVVDALSLFSKKNKETGGNGEGTSDSGDSKGFWGSSAPAGNKAIMSVHMDSEVYNMNHPRRGRAVIFNHENFAPHLELGKRHGTERDRNAVEIVCRKLGFDVTVYDDLTYQNLMEKVDKLSKEDHSKNDCLLVVMLSHGDQHLLYAKDYSYKPESLWLNFTAERCPSLAGKPKLFLIQACQGNQLDEGVRLVKVSRTETDSNPQGYRIPNHADFLIAYSTVPGYYSWRNTTHGSWFMQAICEVFQKYSTKRDLLSMMTIVARKVALNFESNTPSLPHMHQKKQMPFITSTLIRDVYLLPK